MFDTNFFRSDDSDRVKFGQKSNSNNRCIKNVAFGFTIQKKNPQLYIIFSNQIIIKIKFKSNKCLWLLKLSIK